MSLAPIGAIAVLALPALLVAKVPRRWLPFAIGLWIISPAIVFFALEFIGEAIGVPAQPQPGSFSNALLLAGSFLLIPWIMICAAGFGIGFVIRTRLRKPAKQSLPVNAVTPQKPATPIPAPVPISIPVQPVMEGASADGTLRYEHQQGEFINGRYDSVSLCAVVIDAATGQTLVNCAGWASSEIRAQPDGSLFLHLRQNQFQSLFRIDGRTGLFRDLGAGGEDKPLSALAQAVDEAWRTPHASPPQYRYISRDGTIRVDLASQEWSNGNWVNAPRVIEIASGRVLLDLWGTDWDAAVFFREVGRVRLECRRFHLGGGLSVVLDVARGCYQITLDPAHGGVLPEQSLDGIAEGLEAASRHTAPPGQARFTPPHPLAAWRAAVFILLGALILIAAASYMSVRLGSG
ncbi:MAG TPA: hypothetical protein VGM36_11675 [Rhizomicrobium sp.]